MFYLQALSFLFCFGFFYSNYANSSDFGTTGLIDIPSARMSSDGLLTTTAAIQSRTNSYAITYQATLWLEGTFRYTGDNDYFYYDRNYEVKIRLWEEDDYLPQVAVGIRDLVGTGLWGSEYVVASKKIDNFDLRMQGLLNEILTTQINYYEEKCILLYETTNYIGDNSFDDFVEDINFNCSRDEALRISKKNSETIDF